MIRVASNPIPTLPDFRRIRGSGSNRDPGGSCATLDGQTWLTDRRHSGKNKSFSTCQSNPRCTSAVENLFGDSTVDATFNTIRDGLGRLRNAKRQPKVFGAESHGFRLNRPLTERQVQAFEKKHRIQLPADYRAFLLSLGNGGAGPFYGAFKLGEMDDSFDFQKWEEGGGFVGTLSKPFPHTRAWNDLAGEPEEMESEAAYERALDAFERRYWNPENVNGAIPLCHEGCASRDWLVVTGPEAGHMWHDARADRSGLSPIEIGTKKRVRFVDWYIAWLTEAIMKLPKSKH